MDPGKNMVRSCLAPVVAVLACLIVTAAGGWTDGRVLRFSQEAEEEPSPVQRLVLVVDVSQSLHITSSRYLSLTISGGQMRRGLPGFDFSSQRLKNMATALAPAHIRFGGTYADYIHFDPDAVDSSSPEDFTDEMPEFSDSLFEGPFDKKNKKKKVANYTLSAARWDNLTRFCDDAGWDIMWDFNLFFWKKGRWDPSYARKFLKYSASRGVRLPSFQLGNEPNLYKRKYDIDIGGNVLAENFQRLKDLVSVFPQYDTSGLYGPDTTNLDKHRSARTYLRWFLKKGGCDVVNEISLHHYYLAGDSAVLEDFLDPEVMDGLQVQLDYSYNISWGVCRLRKPIRLTETSSATGGGLKDVSNAFAAGFLWLDKLGLAAKNKVTHVFRQTLFGSNYALITRELEPNPDYYLSVLYKRLVEGPVFHVVAAGMSRKLRLYSHCVRKGHYNYPDGALVVYYLNTAGSLSHLSMDQYQNGMVELFIFTPGDSNGMKSRKMNLNGRPLVMRGPNLPRMEPRIHRGDIPVTPLSYGFIVIPNAEVPLCKQYHRFVEHKASTDWQFEQ